MRIMELSRSHEQVGTATPFADLPDLTRTEWELPPHSGFKNRPEQVGTATPFSRSEQIKQIRYRAELDRWELPPHPENRPVASGTPSPQWMLTRGRVKHAP